MSATAPKGTFVLAPRVPPAGDEVPGASSPGRFPVHSTVTTEGAGAHQGGDGVCHGAAWRLGPVTDRRTELLRAARELATVASERAVEAEELRSMPPDLAKAIREAGLFHLALPEVLEGEEQDPLTIIEVVEEMSRGDGSAGWTTLVGNNSCLLAWLEPAVAAQLVSSTPAPVAASVYAPSGQARTIDADTYAVDGRWSFSSGCQHADWFINGVTVMEGDRPKIVPPGRPETRFAVFPAHEGRILDTWNVAGLKGTGSHDVAAEGVVVPIERTIAPFFEDARHDGPLFRLNFFNVAMILFAGFPLGVARRAIEELTSLVHAKSHGSDGGMAADAIIQVELARSHAQLESARAFVLDAVGDSWQTALRGDRPTLQQRRRLVLAVVHAIRSGVAVADTCFRLGGGGALFDSSALQRCFRDMHAGSQHHAFSLGTEKRIGRAILGLEQDTTLL